MPPGLPGGFCSESVSGAASGCSRPPVLLLYSCWSAAAGSAAVLLRAMDPWVTLRRPAGLARQGHTVCSDVDLRCFLAEVEQCKQVSLCAWLRLKVPLRVSKAPCAAPICEWTPLVHGCRKRLSASCLIAEALHASPSNLETIPRACSCTASVAPRTSTDSVPVGLPLLQGPMVGLLPTAAAEVLDKLLLYPAAATPYQ